MLGIESSCDDTGVAVVRASDGAILGQAVTGQVASLAELELGKRIKSHLHSYCTCSSRMLLLCGFCASYTDTVMSQSCACWTLDDEK